MMSIRVLGRAQNASSLLTKAPTTNATRGFATEKQLKTRMKAIQGIGKVTKAMRMVSFAKLRRSQDQLERARSFSKSITDIWPEPAQKVEAEKSNFSGVNYLLVPVIADRGLCGGANSVINRQSRRILNKAIADKPASLNVVVYGEKGRQGLERMFKKYFSATISDWNGKAKQIPFKQVCELSTYILSQKFDRADMVFNKFKNLMIYNTAVMPIVPFEAALESGKFEAYDFEGDGDIMQNLYEFRTAVRLYQAMAENEASELSARTTAMGNSSRNAEEMAAKVKMLYNRTRQSRITTELVEIIGGVVSM